MWISRLVLFINKQTSVYTIEANVNTMLAMINRRDTSMIWLATNNFISTNNHLYKITTENYYNDPNPSGS